MSIQLVNLDRLKLKGGIVNIYKYSRSKCFSEMLLTSNIHCAIIGLLYESRGGGFCLLIFNYLNALHLK